MQLLHKPDQIASTIEELFCKHTSFQFLVAWATSCTRIFPLLKKHPEKLGKSVVGLRFYHTDPKFISEFLKHKNVKYSMKTSGVFHPKVYYFSSSEGNWDLIVGSANLTAGGLGENTEICIHISSEDKGTEMIHEDILTKFAAEFDVAETFTEETLCNYRKHFKRNKRHVQKLADQSEKGDYVRPAFKSELLSLHWKEFYKRVLEDGSNMVDPRIAVLNAASQRFQKHPRFGDMDYYARSKIAGYVNKGKLDWALFGSTGALGVFMNLVNGQDVNICKAVDAIPLAGEVTKLHYSNSVRYFRKAFEGKKGYSLAGLTRLLAMKRPDWFICFNNRNKDGFEREYGVSDRSFDEWKYWDEIIVRSVQSVWWDSKKPTNKREREVWSGRVAFLDLLFYDP